MGKAALKIDPKQARCCCVQPGKRLVQQYHPGIVQHATGKSRALDEAAAEPARKLSGTVSEPGCTERGSGSVDRALEQIQPCCEAKVFQQRQVVVEQRLVGQEANGATRLVRA